MEEKGDALMKEARDVSSGFLSFFRLGSKDRARDKFLSAATQYKVCGNFAKAAEAYEEAAKVSKQTKNEGDLFVDYEEAAGCYRKAGMMKKACELYSKVIDHYEEKQQYFMAAKVCVTLSEIVKEEETISWMERASRCYEVKGYHVSANDIMLKVAGVKAKRGDYDGAHRVYDQLGRKALDDQAGRANAQKLFFMALLTQLATFKSDSIMENAAALQERFEEYQELDTRFNHLTREHILVQGVIEAMQEEDVSKMEEVVAEYDNICPMDEVKEKMLLRAKSALRHRIESLL